MKKLCLVVLVAIFSFTSITAQGTFNASVEVGVITGDASDFTSLGLGAALAYLFEVSDDFHAGPEVGYTNYFGKDFTSGSITFKADDFGVVPILAKAKYNLSDQFYAEGGAGYAVFTEDGGGGEFTWNIGVSYGLDDVWNVGLGYNSITGDGTSIDMFRVRVTRSW